MGESVDITDRESLKAWLEDQPREVAVWIAFRAAARVLPVWWDEVLTEDWARKRDLTALPVLRSLLISSVAAKRPNEKFMGAATLAATGAVEAGAGATRAEHHASADAATRAALAANRVYEGAAHVAADAANAAATASNAATAAWEAVRADAGRVRDGTVPDDLPLWPDGRGPLEEKWRAIVWQVKNSEGAEDWQFWTAWYDSLLDGRPMLGDAGRTWEMLEQIALIDPATWDKGPEAANPVIREIWELHRLRAEVAALQAEKAAFLAARASEVQRGHNQPPEGLVDDAPEVARQITIIWDGLDEARDELERDAPDKGVLRAIAERMLAALNAVGTYCGKVGDAAVMSAATETGKLVARTAYVATLDHIANNGRLMRFVKDLLAFGGG
jgi:hypothetical protein